MMKCEVCGSENVFPGGSWSPAKCRDCGAVEVIDVWEPADDWFWDDKGKLHQTPGGDMGSDADMDEYMDRECPGWRDPIKRDQRYIFAIMCVLGLICLVLIFGRYLNGIN